MACTLLKELTTKKQVDQLIKETKNKVVVLRFGKSDNLSCMQHDEILAKAERELSKMAVIAVVDVDTLPVYSKYFDVTLIPSTIFFWNGRHMKVDFNTQDHTKWIGPFHTKQDFIDLVETIFRGGQHDKYIVKSPIDPKHVPKYQLIYKDI